MVSDVNLHPYIKVGSGSQVSKMKTTVQKQTLNPVSTFDAVVEEHPVRHRSRLL